MRWTQKALGYTVFAAVWAAVVSGGWLVARATHHMILFWVAVIGNAASVAYAGWSAWRGRGDRR